MKHTRMHQAFNLRDIEIKVSLFITVKNIMQGAPWWILINKSADVPINTVAKKLDNITMVQSWNSLNLQQKRNIGFSQTRRACLYAMYSPSVAEAQGMPGMHWHTLRHRWIYYYILYTYLHLYLYKRNKNLPGRLECITRPRKPTWGRGTPRGPRIHANRAGLLAATVGGSRIEQKPSRCLDLATR